MDTLRSISALLGEAHRSVKKLEEDLTDAKTINGNEALAEFYKSTILADMRSLRIAADEMESIASSKRWPYPSYGEILFSVK